METICTVSGKVPSPPFPSHVISRLLRNLTVQVLLAVSLGILLGVIAPGTAKSLKPIGDTFINLVKMVITPIIFLTIVHGIASMADLRKLGRVGGKALLYFELVSTLALVIGLIIVNVTKPGAGLDISTMQLGDVSKYTTAGAQQSTLEFLLHIVPSNVVAAFASGELLPVVFFSVLFGVALTAVGDAGRDIADLLVRFQAVFFKIVSMVMVLAPIGAFGAMAYTVGTFGLKTLVPLARLMLDVYLTMAVFVFVVLGLICRAYGFRLWKFLRFIKDEILLVLGTSSSEAALPRMLQKLEQYGCAKPVVGLVIPTGYSFNLDGTSIYLSMATIFIAQVYKIDLSITQQLTASRAPGLLCWRVRWRPRVRFRWKGLRCCLVWIGLCRKHGRLPISSATAWPRWSCPAVKGRLTMRSVRPRKHRWPRSATVADGHRCSAVRHKKKR